MALLIIHIPYYLCWGIYLRVSFTDHSAYLSHVFHVSLHRLSFLWTWKQWPQWCYVPALHVHTLFRLQCWKKPKDSVHNISNHNKKEPRWWPALRLWAFWGLQEALFLNVKYFLILYAIHWDICRQGSELLGFYLLTWRLQMCLKHSIRNTSQKEERACETPFWPSGLEYMTVFLSKNGHFPCILFFHLVWTCLRIGTIFNVILS